MSYVIGVSSGIFGATPTEERTRGTSVGLFNKAQYSITKGVQFVQIDLESISEFKEPNLKENMEKIKRMGISFGIHSEVAAFGGREFPHLDSAIDTDYERSHKRLAVVLEESGKLGSEYVLIHSSESTPFLLLGRELQPTSLVDIWGRPLWEFLQKDKYGEELKKWAIEKDFVKEIFLPGYLIDFNEIVKREIEMERERKERTYRAIKGKLPGEKLTEEEIKEHVELSEEEIENLKRRIREDFKRNLETFLQTRSLSYGPERLAYFIIAKWMELQDDPLWNNIIEASVEYFSRVEGKGKEEWLREKGIRKINSKWSIDDDNLRKEYRLWVPAVSAKYIWGHLNQDKCPTGEVYPDLKKFIEKYKLPLLFETPMASPGLEEWLRLPNPLQIYYLIKEIGPEYTQLAIDIEHMLMCNLDPKVCFELLPEGSGKYIKVIHAGWPSTLGPAHIPIYLGSEQQVYLYQMYYLLRQKGCGKENKVFIVFERGGGPDPIMQSIISLRKIVEFLEKDTPPEKLPLEFFGIEPGEISSIERQKVAIRAHAFDPLKGLLKVPEEEHGIFGRMAAEEGKAETWKREELR